MVYTRVLRLLPKQTEMVRICQPWQQMMCKNLPTMTTEDVSECVCVRVMETQSKWLYYYSIPVLSVTTYASRTFSRAIFGFVFVSISILLLYAPFSSYIHLRSTSIMSSLFAIFVGIHWLSQNDFYCLRTVTNVSLMHINVYASLRFYRTFSTINISRCWINKLAFFTFVFRCVVETVQKWSNIRIKRRKNYTEIEPWFRIRIHVYSVVSFCCCHC